MSTSCRQRLHRSLPFCLYRDDIAYIVPYPSVYIDDIAMSATSCLHHVDIAYIAMTPTACRHRLQRSLPFCLQQCNVNITYNVPYLYIPGRATHVGQVVSWRPDKASIAMTTTSWGYRLNRSLPFCLRRRHSHHRDKIDSINPLFSNFLNRPHITVVIAMWAM